MTDEKNNVNQDNQADQENFVDEEFVAEDGEGNTEDKVKSLKDKLKKALAEKQEYLNGWQRAKADFINARKRDEEYRKELVKFANEDLLTQLTAVLDSFSMAFSNKDAWERVDKNWRTGVEYIYSQLKGILEQNGFKEFDPLGEKFDPARRHAIESVPVTNPDQDQVILQVIHKGYHLHGKIVRPATVKIGAFHA